MIWSMIALSGVNTRTYSLIWLHREIHSRNTEIQKVLTCADWKNVSKLSDLESSFRFILGSNEMLAQIMLYKVAEKNIFTLLNLYISFQKLPFTKNLQIL